jgi:long-subunit fatty acid transport protein
MGVLLFPQVSDAGSQKRLGRAVLHVLKVDQGARIAGLGGAFVAVADDIHTIFVNPAGLTHIEKAEYMLSYTRWLVDSKFYSGAFAYNTRRGVLGLSVMAFSLPKTEETTIFQPQGTGRQLDTGDVSIGVSYARKMTDKLSFGAQMRWTQETLDQDRLSAVDVNLGTIFYTGFKSLRLGMGFTNLGRDQRVREMNYQMPVMFNFAFAVEALGKKGGDTYLTVTGENQYATDFAEPQYRVGGELWFKNTLALRGGYKFNYDLETYSLGVGVRFHPVKRREIRADFAYSSFSYKFDAPLRFSLSGSF